MLYDEPRYYEIAFSFRDIPQEVDVLEASMQRFSQIPVKSVLELGCGTCPYVSELVGRGYTYVGLDLSEKMLAYSRRKTAAVKGSVKFVPADMNNFSLDEPVDFVYIPLGSLYIQSTAELSTHFDSVRKSLRKGGLYFLDWCVNFTPFTDSSDSWRMEENGISVQTSYQTKCLSPVQQLVEETILLEISEGNAQKSIEHKEKRKLIYPQEFLDFVHHADGFEFVGWWDNWDLNRPLENAETINRPVIIVRRT